MPKQTRSLLAQIMPNRLFGAKPLPEPMLAYFKLDPWGQVSVKFNWATTFLFILENKFENIMCKMATIFYPQCVEYGWSLAICHQRTQSIHPIDHLWWHTIRYMILKKNNADDNATSYYLSQCPFTILSLSSFEHNTYDKICSWFRCVLFSRGCIIHSQYGLFYSYHPRLFCV